MANIAGRMGILVGGGPAPGINGVIGAATVEAIKCGLDVVGIYDGFKWLMKRDTSHVTSLSIGDVSQARLRGGSILHTSRANPTKSEDDMRNVLAALKELGISYLVTIGGDDTAFAASKVFQSARSEPGYRLRVAHVPKTIDNDLPLPGNMPTFGFQTARTVAAELVRNLVEDARTTRRWYVAVLMGAKAGHLPLGAGNAGGATLTIIPEEFAEGSVTIALLCDVIEAATFKAKSLAHDYGVVVVAEGLAEKLREEELQGSQLAEVRFSSYGKLRLADVPLGLTLRRELTRRQDGYAKERAERFGDEKSDSVSFVDVTIGYELRCAPPIPYDAEYCQELGWGAVRYLLDRGEESYADQGAMISVQAGEVVPIPFSRILDPETGKCSVRYVNMDSDEYRAARGSMIRLEREDVDGPVRLASFAEAAGLSPDEFGERYAHVVRL